MSQLGWIMLNLAQNILSRLCSKIHEITDILHATMREEEMTCKTGYLITWK